jgi:hypothetical protein
MALVHVVRVRPGESELVVQAARSLPWLAFRHQAGALSIRANHAVLYLVSGSAWCWEVRQIAGPGSDDGALRACHRKSRSIHDVFDVQPQLVMECTGYQRVGFIRVEASAKVR